MGSAENSARPSSASSAKRAVALPWFVSNECTGASSSVLYARAGVGHWNAEKKPNNRNAGRQGRKRRDQGTFVGRAPLNSGWTFAGCRPPPPRVRREGWFSGPLLRPQGCQGGALLFRPALPQVPLVQKQTWDACSAVISALVYAGNCRVAHVEAPGNFARRFTSFPPFQCFSSLKTGQFELRSELHTPCFCPSPPLPRSCSRAQTRPSLPKPSASGLLRAVGPFLPMRPATDEPPGCAVVSRREPSGADYPSGQTTSDAPASETHYRRCKCDERSGPKSTAQHDEASMEGAWPFKGLPGTTGSR